MNTLSTFAVLTIGKRLRQNYNYKSKSINSRPEDYPGFNNPTFNNDKMKTPKAIYNHESSSLVLNNREHIKTYICLIEEQARATQEINTMNDYINSLLIIYDSVLKRKLDNKNTSEVLNDIEQQKLTKIIESVLAHSKSKLENTQFYNTSRYGVFVQPKLKAELVYFSYKVRELQEKGVNFHKNTHIEDLYNLLIEWQTCLNVYKCDLNESRKPIDLIIEQESEKGNFAISVDFLTLSESKLYVTIKYKKKSI